MNHEPWNPVSRHSTNFPRLAPGGKAPSDGILAGAVSRIRDVVEPRRTILFGSAGRREVKGDSDLDFLVIVDPEDGRRFPEDGIHSRLHADLEDRKKGCLGFDHDVVVATPRLMEEQGPCPATVCGAALEEGRIVHERQP